MSITEIEQDIISILTDCTETGKGFVDFITLGFAALLILTAMAVTSTNGMRRRLGKRWQQLHYGAYIAGILGVWHYWWQVKKDIQEPLIYAVILSILLGFRIWVRVAKKSKA